MSKQVVVIPKKRGCLSGCGSLVVIFIVIAAIAGIFRQSSNSDKRSESVQATSTNASTPYPADSKERATNLVTSNSQVAPPNLSTSKTDVTAARQDETSRASIKPVKGSRVKLKQDTPLYFNDSVNRQGVAGQEFDVFDYRPDKNKVYLLLHGSDGKPFALNVSENFVTVTSTPPSQPQWSTKGPRPSQQEADTFLGITEQELTRRLGKPLKTDTSNSPDGPFKMLVYDQTNGAETFFSYFVRDGVIDAGQYRGVSLSVKQSQAPTLTTQQLVERYIKTLSAAGLDKSVIDSVSALGKKLTIRVANSWHYSPQQIRLQAAQNLWKIWAALASPNEPDMARIELTDLNGNTVGGSRVWGGSLIWVKD